MLLLIAAAFAQEPIGRTLPAGMPLLQLVVPSGRVRVTVDPSATESSLMAYPANWSEGCDLQFSGDRNAAVAEVVQPKAIRRHCRTDMEIVLAGDTELDIQLGGGRVEVIGLDAPVAVDLRRGRVRLQDVSGPVEVDVAVGRVALAWSEAYEEQAHAKVGLGRVLVDIPYGSWVAQDLSAPVGRVRSPIPQGLEAETILEARALVGGVRVDTSEVALAQQVRVAEALPQPEPQPVLAEELPAEAPRSSGLGHFGALSRTEEPNRN